LIKKSLFCGAEVGTMKKRKITEDSVKETLINYGSTLYDAGCRSINFEIPNEYGIPDAASGRPIFETTKKSRKKTILYGVFHIVVYRVFLTFKEIGVI